MQGLLRLAALSKGQPPDNIRGTGMHMRSHPCKQAV